MKNIERLKEILSIESESYKVERVTDFIKIKAKELGANVIEELDNNLYITKGIPSENGYPCIVAHTDTVHKILKDSKLKVCQLDDDHLIGFDESTKSLSGIGGDDKVGIYIALSMLEELDSIKLAFFKDEEVGCLGSKEAKMEFFEDVMYVLQCDRKGNSDFVNKISTSELQSKDFMEDVTPIITAHNYKFSVGGITDVEALYKKGLPVSSANMSCGYYNPHSEDEIVCISDVFRCEEMVYDIFMTLVKKYPIEIYVKPVSTYYPKSYKYPKKNKRIKKHNYLAPQFNWGDDIDYYGNKKVKRNMKPAIPDDGYTDNKNLYNPFDTIDDNFKTRNDLYEKSLKQKCWDCGRYFTQEHMHEHGLCVSCYIQHTSYIN